MRIGGKVVFGGGLCRWYCRDQLLASVGVSHGADKDMGGGWYLVGLWIDFSIDFECLGQIEKLISREKLKS